MPPAQQQQSQRQCSDGVGVAAATLTHDHCRAAGQLCCVMLPASGGWGGRVSGAVARLAAESPAVALAQGRAGRFCVASGRPFLTSNAALFPLTAVNACLAAYHQGWEAGGINR